MFSCIKDIYKNIGYIVLFVLMVAIDQTTKRASLNAFLEWFDPNDTRSYRSSTKHVFSIGQVPMESMESMDSTISKMSNWLDFHITYVRNHGAAWGMFSNSPEFIRLWGFYLITILISCYIIYLFKQSNSLKILERCGYICILSGAVGNLIDRAILKYVIDWVHFSWKIFGWSYDFPVFNWADISINIGIGLIIVDSVISSTKNKTDNSSSASKDEHEFI